MRCRREIPTVLLLMLTISWTLPLNGQASDKPADKLSPAFSQATMAALADIYRWKEDAQATAKSALPNQNSDKHLKSVAYEHLRQAQMAAKTEGDQQAGAMLQKHFSDVNAWTSKLIEARRNLDATNVIDPSNVDEDPDLTKINKCEKAFNTMLGSGTFTPIRECQ